MLKILVVDDEVDVCETCVIYLVNNGFNARGASNSSKAFECLNVFGPDIVVLDINLREQYNGVDILKKAIEIKPNIKAIMLTGLEKGNDAKEALRCGAKIILKKPITISDLKEAIEDISKS